MASNASRRHRRRCPRAPPHPSHPHPYVFVRTQVLCSTPPPLHLLVEAMPEAWVTWLQRWPVASLVLREGCDAVRARACVGGWARARVTARGVNAPVLLPSSAPPPVQPPAQAWASCGQDVGWHACQALVAGLRGVVVEQLVGGLGTFWELASLPALQVRAVGGEGGGFWETRCTRPQLLLPPATPHTPHLRPPPSAGPALAGGGCPGVWRA